VVAVRGLFYRRYIGTGSKRNRLGTDSSSGVFELIPLAFSFAVGGDCFRSFPHELRVGQFRELVPVVSEVAEVTLESSWVAKMDSDFPTAFAVEGCVFFDAGDRPEHRASRLEEQVSLGFLKDLFVVVVAFALCRPLRLRSRRDW
jgi:hypothetical protein